MAQRIPCLYVAESDIGGRGVFTAKSLQKDDLIEICPVIILPKEDLCFIEKTTLHDYYFLWGVNQKLGVLALGYGSLYNHSYKPNAFYKLDLTNHSIDFYCVKNIAAGEEITVNYNGDPKDETEVWFEKRNE